MSSKKESTQNVSQSRFQRSLALTDEGYRNFKRSVIACAVTQLTFILPFALTINAFWAVLRVLMGNKEAWNSVWWSVPAGLAGAVLTFLCSRNDYRKTYITAYRESEVTRLTLADHLRKLPMSFFNRRDISEISGNIMADVTAQETLFTVLFPQMLSNCISATVTYIGLAFFDWRLALCVFGMLPATAVVVLISNRREKNLFERQTQARLAAVAHIQEYVDGIRDIRACRRVGARAQLLEQSLRNMRDIAFRTEVYVSVVVGIAQSVLQMGMGLVVFVGTLLLVAGQVDFLVLLAFLLIVSRVYSPLMVTLGFLAGVLYFRTRTARMRALRNEPIASGNRSIEVCPHRIEFSGVRFAYGKEDVLKDLSFTIEPGKVTALVEPSGSGKSTCAQLVARFWVPQQGKVLIDGVDAAELNEESWPGNVSIVFQEVTLFDETLMENIRIGRVGATDDEVLAAAHAAHCDEFVSRLSDGWQTRIGENGAKLSGGERQRVSIARALLKDAPIVLLDEATSSLDPENETLVQQAVSRLVAGKTVLVIAHRLRTIVNADKIVVLDGGRVVEEGTHDALIAHHGLYARLWALQQESFGWNIKRARRASEIAG